MAQSYLKLSEAHDQALINFLNASEKCGEYIVIQFGSQSTKIGLASQI